MVNDEKHLEQRLKSYGLTDEQIQLYPVISGVCQ